MIGFFDTEYCLVGMDAYAVESESGEKQLELAFGVGHALTQLLPDGRKVAVAGPDGSPIVLEQGVVRFKVERDQADAVVKMMQEKLAEMSGLHLGKTSDLIALDDARKKKSQNGA